MSNHLTEDRIAAALAAATQPEDETPWAELTTPPPMTHAEVRQAIHRAEHPEVSLDFFGASGPTLQAEGSRARIVQELARRDGYLAALSAAEQILSSSPVLPTHVDIRLAPWDDGPYVVISFHKDPSALRAFASHFGTEVTELPHLETDIRVETSGTTESGIRFEAYTLVDAPAEGPHDPPFCGADLGPGYSCRRPASHAGDCEPTQDTAEDPQAVTA